MGLLIIAVAGVGVIGWYLAKRSSTGLQTFASAPLNISRNIGTVPGSTVPGSTLPGQSVEGPGPNTTASLVGTAGAAGAGLATMAASSAGITALGAATLGIGVIVGIGLTLWLAHAARVKGAKDENAVLNELVPNFSKCLAAEFDALNSGQVSPTTALQDLEGMRQTYWTAIASYQKGPGQHTHPCKALAATNKGGPTTQGEYAPGCYPWQSPVLQTTPCDKTCTAGCCIGCDYVEPALCSAKWLLQQPGGGAIKVHAVGASKYGYSGQPGFTLRWAPRG